MRAIFRADQSEGINTDMAFQLARAKLPTITLAEVKSITKRLSEQGVLYSTIDDEHYKSLE